MAIFFLFLTKILQYFNIRIQAGSGSDANLKIYPMEAAIFFNGRAIKADCRKKSSTKLKKKKKLFILRLPCIKATFVWTPITWTVWGCRRWPCSPLRSSPQADSCRWQSPTWKGSSKKHLRRESVFFRRTNYMDPEDQCFLRKDLLLSLSILKYYYRNISILSHIKPDSVPNYTSKNVLLGKFNFFSHFKRCTLLPGQSTKGKYSYVQIF